MLPTPGLTGGLAALLLPGVSLAGGEIIAGSGLPGIGLGRLLSTPGRSGGADRSLVWRCAPRGLPLRRVLALWLRSRRPLRLLGLPLRRDLPGRSLTWIVAGGCGLTGGVGGLAGSAGLLAPGGGGCAAWFLWGGRVVLWGARCRLRGRRFCRGWCRWFWRLRPAPLALLGGSLIPFNEFRHRDATRAGGMGRAAGLLWFVGWFGSVMRGRPHPIRLLHGALLSLGISPAVLGCFLL